MKPMRGTVATRSAPISTQSGALSGGGCVRTYSTTTTTVSATSRSPTSVETTSTTAYDRF